MQRAAATMGRHMAPLLREAAAALEAAREDAWIACSERTPERDGLGAVLAFDADRPRKGVWLETTHPSWWGQFMEDANEWGPSVTHWRTLPAPPKEARND